MSMCRIFSCVVGRGCLLWPVRSLGRTPLGFALLHCVLQGQILYFLLLHSSSLQWKGHHSLVGLRRTIQLQLLQHYWLGHRLGLLWYWMVCLGNRDLSVIFEIALKYYISVLKVLQVLFTYRTILISHSINLFIFVFSGLKFYSLFLHHSESVPCALHLPDPSLRNRNVEKWRKAKRENPIEMPEAGI